MAKSVSVIPDQAQVYSPPTRSTGYGPAGDRVRSRSISTYRASTTTVFAAAAGTAPFFLLYGSTTGYKVVRLRRIVVSCLTLTAVAYLPVNLIKYSGAAPTDGTVTALVQTAVDSRDGAATLALCSVYTAAPTAGTLVGTLASERVLGQATTAAAAGVPHVPIRFEFQAQGDGESEAPVLRSSSEGVGLLFPAAPATAVTMALCVEWTEED